MGSITVNRTELGKAFDFAQLGLSKRPVCPVLAGLDGEAWLGFTSASKPLLVTSPDGFTGVCMPVRNANS